MIKFTYYKPRILIPVIGITWSLSSWILSNLWGYGFLQGLGPTAIVMGILTLYDKWLWKFPVLNLMAAVPDLNGIYKGEIFYHWNDEELTKKCQLEIKQTLSAMKITSYFSKKGENDTQSTSIEAFIKTDKVGDQRLYFYYQNRGSCKRGDTLDCHDGINVLDIRKNKDSIELHGYYFTNRNPQTMGTMSVKIEKKGNS